jgi:hypothetical protein
MRNLIGAVERIGESKVVGIQDFCVPARLVFLDLAGGDYVRTTMWPPGGGIRCQMRYKIRSTSWKAETPEVRNELLASSLGIPYPIADQGECGAGAGSSSDLLFAMIAITSAATATPATNSPVQSSMSEPSSQQQPYCPRAPFSPKTRMPWVFAAGGAVFSDHKR